MSKTPKKTPKKKTINTLSGKLSSNQTAKDQIPERLAILPTIGVVPLPGLVLPLTVSNNNNLEAIEFARENGDFIGMTLQTTTALDPEDIELPNVDNLCLIGGLARIENFIQISNGDIKVRFRVIRRIKITKFVEFEPFIKATVEEIEEPAVQAISKKEELLLSDLKDKFAILGEYDPSLDDHIFAAQEIYNPGSLADLIGSVLPLDELDAQHLLEELDPLARLELISGGVDKQLDILAIKEKISSRVHREIGKAHHQELLREQMRQIQAELGENIDIDDDVDSLKERINKIKLPKDVAKETQKQIRRLQHLHPDTSESALARTYIDWILDLPWAKKTKDRLDLSRARQILDSDHFGLDKTKDRILDFLGVRKLRKDHRGPVLLLVGPPGVGKTSLGRSIANALGRKFVHMSVGGLRDEAELRGHRRTYVGALPGRIIQGIKNAGSVNPVFMLDELDKIGSNFRGDPASVLLEVLDPEQNKGFVDHYLNIPFDLSEVMFIGTANVTDSIPRPLLDRMEVIEISGYTNKEKLEIAKRYLIPQEQEENGLKKSKVSLSEPAINHIINGYTRESGVRELRRTLSTIFRKVARLIAEEKQPPTNINPKIIEKFLGPEKHLPDQRLNTDQIGVATGLAWTSVGGEILTVEVAITKGKGTLSLTGQMGEVMQESAQAALTYVRSRAGELGINQNFYASTNIHVHVPQGAIPKDGPSAGVAIATALVSALTRRPVSKNVSMTGEITLRGNVLAIGGLKEKALAALRTDIPVVFFPKENERELIEFPKYLTDKVTFIPVEHVDEIINSALVEKTRSKTSKKRTPKTKRPRVR